VTELYRRERLDRGIKVRCSDISVLSSYRDIMYLVFPRAIPIVAILIFPLLGSKMGAYWERVFFMCCTYALLSLSWELLISAGMFSLGQALFFGVGGYLAAIIDRLFHWPFAFTILLATVAGAVFCALILSPLVRLRGIYFAMITFVLPMLAARVIEATGILGGHEGLPGLTPLPRGGQLYVAPVALLIALFGLRRLIGSDYGVVLQGVRDDDRAVMAGGINIYWYKTQAIFLAGLVGAFSGAVSAHYYQFAGMSFFALDLSILPLTCSVVGGVGEFAGSTLGAFILVPVSEAFRIFGPLRVVFYCFILVIFVAMVPEGIYLYLRRKYHQFERLVPLDVKG